MTDKSGNIFHCKKCGTKGEQCFDWSGSCLVCEENAMEDVPEPIYDHLI